MNLFFLRMNEVERKSLVDIFEPKSQDANVNTPKATKKEKSVKPETSKKTPKPNLETLKKEKNSQSETKPKKTPNSKLETPKQENKNKVDNKSKKKSKTNPDASDDITFVEEVEIFDDEDSNLYCKLCTNVYSSEPELTTHLAWHKKETQETIQSTKKEIKDLKAGLKTPKKVPKKNLFPDDSPEKTKATKTPNKVAALKVKLKFPTKDLTKENKSKKESHKKVEPESPNKTVNKITKETKSPSKAKTPNKKIMKEVESKEAEPKEAKETKAPIKAKTPKKKIEQKELELEEAEPNVKEQKENASIINKPKTKSKPLESVDESTKDKLMALWTIPGKTQKTPRKANKDKTIDSNSTESPVKIATKTPEVLEKMPNKTPSKQIKKEPATPQKASERIKRKRLEEEEEEEEELVVLVPENKRKISKSEKPASVYDFVDEKPILTKPLRTSDKKKWLCDPCELIFELKRDLTTHTEKVHVKPRASGARRTRSAH